MQFGSETERWAASLANPRTRLQRVLRAWSAGAALKAGVDNSMEGAAVHTGTRVSLGQRLSSPRPFLSVWIRVFKTKLNTLLFVSF